MADHRQFILFGNLMPLVQYLGREPVSSSKLYTHVIGEFGRELTVDRMIMRLY